MTTKKIWIFAILFGIISAVIIVSLVNIKDPIVEIVEVEVYKEPEPKDESVPELIQVTIVDPLEISEGMSAVSIDITSFNEGVAGFLLPGAIVDIYAYHEEEHHTYQTHKIFEEVKVLAVGNINMNEYVKEGFDENHSYENITLEVTEEQALTLVNHLDHLFYAVLKDYSYEYEYEYFEPVEVEE